MRATYALVWLSYLFLENAMTKQKDVYFDIFEPQEFAQLESQLSPALAQAASSLFIVYWTLIQPINAGTGERLKNAQIDMGELARYSPDLSMSTLAVLEGLWVFEKRSQEADLVLSLAVSRLVDIIHGSVSGADGDLQLLPALGRESAIARADAPACGECKPDSRRPRKRPRCCEGP